MSEETPESDDPRAPPLDSVEASLSPTSSSSSSSSSRLNARAPEYVPRTSHHGQSKEGHQIPQSHRYQHQHHPHQQRPPPRMMQIHHHHVPHPAPPSVIHLFSQHGAAFHASVMVPSHGYGGGVYGEHESGHGVVDLDIGTGHGASVVDLEDHASSVTAGGLSEEVVQKVTKQVEYYFSDLNLATTEHLMRFISKDPEGFVPISVIASFKKIRALVNNNSQLAAALQTSKKLVVSDDGKKVKRHHPITESGLEDLQSRIIVAENLPEDHCYQSLFKVFSVVGGVKTIRTCYPQTPNGASPVNPRPGKMETFLLNKLHAFVEYETIDQAEKAVGELNDEGNWRSGLRVRLLPSCMKHCQGRSKKAGHEADGNLEEDDVLTSKQLNEKQPEEQSQPLDFSQEEIGEEGHHDKEGTVRRGKGRGRGSKGRGKGPHHNNCSGSHPIGTPPSHSVQIEQHAATKQPPGPRMPDGTRGFTMGRGKPLEYAGTTP